MDRRGLSRTKAAHVNPVPLFVLAVVLYIADLIFVTHGSPWWSYPMALGTILLTGLITFLSQSRFAENSTPVYFAVFLFLAGTAPELVIFGTNMLSALCMCVTLFYVLKFICEDKRRDYLVNATFFCILASVPTPSFIWFLPLIMLTLLEESDRKGGDSLILLGSAISACAIITGVLYLILGWEATTERLMNQVASFTSCTPPAFRELPVAAGLYESWKSTAFADSVAYCLLLLGGIYVIAAFLAKRNRMKTDDAVISKITIRIALLAIALEWLFPADSTAYWLTFVAMISVPTSHLLAGEGKHIFSSVVLSVIFLLEMMSVIPIFGLR